MKSNSSQLPVKLSIIIVSYNTKAHTLNCLRSINNSTDNINKEIIVIDNASSDGSVDAIRQQFPQVKIIANHHNPGFGTANNQGAAQAQGDFMLFLNSDTIIKKDTIQKLMDQLVKENSQLATCQLQNPNGTIQPQGGYLPHLWRIISWMLFIDDLPLIRLIYPAYQMRRRNFFQNDHSLGWIGGTAMLIKKDLFIKLRGFDERIFMYAEDIDLCWRANQLGVKPRYYHQPQIIHLGQQSGSTRQSLLGEYQGIIYLATKYLPSWQIPLVRFFLKLGAWLRLIVFGIISSDGHKKDTYHKALKLV